MHGTFFRTPSHPYNSTPAPCSKCREEARIFEFQRDIDFYNPHVKLLRIAGQQAELHCSKHDHPFSAWLYSCKKYSAAESGKQYLCKYCQYESIVVPGELSADDHKRQLASLFPHVKLAVEWTRTRNPHTYLCTIHNLKFEDAPRRIVRKVNPCPKCRKLHTSKTRARPRGYQVNDAEYAKRLKRAGKGIIALEPYSGGHMKIKHECIHCGHVFRRAPAYYKHGCKSCANKKLSTDRTRSREELELDYADYRRELRLRYGRKIRAISKPGRFRGRTYRVWHKCACGAIWSIAPCNVLAFDRIQCKSCSSYNGYSPISQEWLQKVTRRKLQTATNGGEYRIQTLRSTMHVDGFHAITKTVYEFLGDVWHGNLHRFKPMDRPSPYNERTAKAMHSDTIHRFRLLSQLGYTVVYVWESDFKNGKMVSGTILPFNPPEKTSRL